jgi:tetratricopeptide (TPR) repeat protein
MLRARVGCLAVTLAALAGCAGESALRAVTSGGALPAVVELDATPFHPQARHQCGPAALATVLGAAGSDAQPDALAGDVFLPGRSGSLQVELAAAIRARGLLAYQVSPGLDALAAEVAAGRPVLVLQRLGVSASAAWHYAVVIGYDADRGTVLLRSGTTRRLEMRAAAFDYTWSHSGRWGLLAVQPGEIPAHAGLEAYVAAAAALEKSHADKALAAYRAAAARWPDAALPWLGIGNVAAALGDWRAAESAYSEALQRDAADAAALNNHAEALARLGCPTAARAALDDALARLPADAPLRGALQSSYGGLPAARSADPPRCAALVARP